MIYMKAPSKKRISVDRLTFVCDCPICGKEVLIPDFLDMMSDPDIDIDESSSILCDECGEEVRKQQKRGN